jgi:glycosidase
VNAVQLNLLGSHDTPRLITMCGGDVAAVRLATLIQMTVGGAPCIYYGDEIGMAGEQDPFSRASFPVDPAAGDTSLRAYVAALAALRHANRALRRGEFAVVGADGSTAAYRRSDDDTTFVVCLNAGAEPARLAFDLPELSGRSLVAVRLPGAEAGAPVPVVDGRAEMEIPGRSGIVLKAEA